MFCLPRLVKEDAGKVYKLSIMSFNANFTLVYLATDKDTPRPDRVVKIATKLIATNKKYVRLVNNEARALESCTQLNVPKIYSHSADPPFIVEEFIEGRTLEKDRSIDH